MNIRISLFMLTMILRDFIPLNFFIPLNERLSEALSKLRSDGVALLPTKLSNSESEEIKEWIDSNLSNSKKHGSDYRIWTAQEKNKLVNDLFSNNIDIKQIGKRYLKSNITLQTTMAAKLLYQPGNLGSGQGWHRDSYSAQYKTMCYLNDVDEDGGPFEYVIKSHTYKNIYNELVLNNKTKERYRYSRFEPDFVELYMERFNLKSEKFYGKKGEIILFDSRGVHRGHPINKGKRYAITNYFIKASQNKNDNLLEN